MPATFKLWVDRLKWPYEKPWKEDNGDNAGLGVTMKKNKTES
jgi:hypothetical protein